MKAKLAAGAASEILACATWVGVERVANEAPGEIRRLPGEITAACGGGDKIRAGLARGTSEPVLTGESR